MKNVILSSIDTVENDKLNNFTDALCTIDHQLVQHTFLQVQLISLNQSSPIGLPDAYYFEKSSDFILHRIK